MRFVHARLQYNMASDGFVGCSICGSWLLGVGCAMSAGKESYMSKVREAECMQLVLGVIGSDSCVASLLLMKLSANLNMTKVALDGSVHLLW